jgi:hypothetical protein
VAGSCKYDDEPAGSGALDLVRYNLGGGGREVHKIFKKRRKLYQFGNV